MLPYSVGNTKVDKLAFPSYPYLLFSGAAWLGWVAKLLGSFCALALLWAMAFAPTIGRSGFPIMVFNSFQKNRGKKKRHFLFNNDAAYTLLICFLEKTCFPRENLCI